MGHTSKKSGSPLTDVLFFNRAAASEVQRATAVELMAAEKLHRGSRGLAALREIVSAAVGLRTDIFYFFLVLAKSTDGRACASQKHIRPRMHFVLRVGAEQDSGSMTQGAAQAEA